ncbi:MAG: LamB/YcsF family protein [Acidobacteria bacterium]|nr:LamB/YcsF family protein [Acidobacteriota bacterium]MBS1865833.1 LamB/YcsF family protein [Acidobacteriota bacterium]
MQRIDLNCDMGELPEAVADGSQELLMRWITSANIACGGHAGDAEMMETTIRQALKHKVAIGAHPGYPDRENFGRFELKMPAREVSDCVFEQVSALAAVAARLGAKIRHVKPHGALYNQAVHNAELAGAIADGVSRWSSEVALVGLADSPMLDIFRKAGFEVAAEAFADRRYEPDGTLRPRKFRDALLHEPADAATQAVSIATRGMLLAQNGSEISVHARTLCIHSDTPGSDKIAAGVAQALRAAGVSVQPL